MALHVTARFVSRDDTRETLKNLLIALVEPIRQDPGCERCHFVQDAANPNHFVFIEEWTGKAALDRHLAEDFVKRAIDESAPLLGEAVDLRLHEALR